MKYLKSIFCIQQLSIRYDKCNTIFSSILKQHFWGGERAIEGQEPANQLLATGVLMIVRPVVRQYREVVRQSWDLCVDGITMRSYYTLPLLSVVLPHPLFDCVLWTAWINYCNEDEKRCRAWPAPISPQPDPALLDLTNGYSVSVLEHEIST